MRLTPKIKKISRYEDWDFYDDHMVNEMNDRLYETMIRTRRSPFVIFPKDIEIIFEVSGIDFDRHFKMLCLKAYGPDLLPQ